MKDDLQLLNCGLINEFSCIDSIHHEHYGIATFIRSDLCDDCSVLLKSNINNIEILVIKLNDVKILNVYKPPGSSWSTPLPVFNHPAVYMGDFNSHHCLWGYNQDDLNGEFILDWANRNRLHLLFDAKDKSTFHSGRWNRGYNPDLCFVSTDDSFNVLSAVRTVSNKFPRSQHRCVFLEVGIKIPIIKSLPKPRWNFKKGNWTEFAKAIDSNIRWIPPVVENYNRFVGLLISTAKRFIPRGFRRTYIPNWSDECERLWLLYQENESKEIADELINELNQERTAKWINLVETMDFSRSSRKAWDLLKKSGDSSNKNGVNITTVHPKDVASRLVKNSKCRIPKNKIRNVKNKWRRSKKLITDSPLASSVSFDEINSVLTYLKPRKASGVDEVFPEVFINLSKNARNWLAKFYSDCYNRGKIPPIWNLSKVRAILKPGKDKHLPENYRPISSLCIGYKIFEKIIYNRIFPTLDENIPNYQAGFRPGRNCCDQVLSLVTHIEAGFQDKLQTAVAFVDLSAAYDTIWKKGLMLKLSKILKCSKTLNMISALLSNRKFVVHLGNQKSRIRCVNNGLPQGSVLAPVLFNVYTSDLPETKSRKFLYADDLAIAYQFPYNDRAVVDAERTLTLDLDLLNDYYKNWRLKANPSKTEVAFFHLSNQHSNTRLNVYMDGILIKFNQNPMYLGVTLDRALTFRIHCLKLGQKIKSRVNIIQKLSGTRWGANAKTLRISAISLVYSTAEYCSPVWEHSAHTNHVDTKLNSCMRIISGTIKTTPLPWLPILSNIEPPHLRRQLALYKEHLKITRNLNLPIHFDIDGRIENRLNSRKPFWTKIAELGDLTNYDINNNWKALFNESEFVNKHLIEDPTLVVPRFTNLRYRWTLVNRFRTNHGVTNSELNRYNHEISAACDCGHPIQNIVHIYQECIFRRFKDGLEEIHQMTDDAILWMDNLDIFI